MGGIVHVQTTGDAEQNEAIWGFLDQKYSFQIKGVRLDCGSLWSFHPRSSAEHS